jgi:thiol-disulfide isomerase/thioredoxin
VAGALLLALPCARADDAKPANRAKPVAPNTKNLLSDDAKKAWDEVVESTRPPKPPAAWNQKAPTEAERSAFALEMGKAAALAADKAKEFLVRFPEHEKADDARDIQHRMLVAAVQLGVKDREKELKELAAADDEPNPPKAAAARPAPADDRPHVLPDDEAKAWEQIEADRKALGPSAALLADKMREFYVRFPKHEKAEEAKDSQRQLLMMAVQLGVRERLKELQAVAGADDEVDAPPAEFVRKHDALIARAQKLEDKGMEAVLTEYEKGLRELQKEYPDRPEIYEGLLQVAQGIGGEKSVTILKEVAASNAPEQLKKMAASVLKTQERIGQPLDIKFKSVDGREVDLAKLKGKVVLVDFWATWCAPCVAEVPKVVETYGKLHPKGFEIIGISFDQEQEALEQFVKRKQMPWPQYFDGEGWGNKFGREYGISGIPAMWLVDKKGNLRDLNAREDLAGKVEKLLAEK